MENNNSIFIAVAVVCVLLSAVDGKQYETTVNNISFNFMLPYDNVDFGEIVGNTVAGMYPGVVVHWYRSIPEEEEAWKKLGYDTWCASQFLHIGESKSIHVEVFGPVGDEFSMWDAETIGFLYIPTGVGETYGSTITDSGTFYWSVSADQLNVFAYMLFDVTPDIYMPSPSVGVPNRTISGDRYLIKINTYELSLSEFWPNLFLKYTSQ